MNSAVKYVNRERLAGIINRRDLGRNILNGMAALLTLSVPAAWQDSRPARASIADTWHRDFVQLGLDMDKVSDEEENLVETSR